MSNTDLLAPKQKFDNLRSLLESGKAQLELAMAKHMSSDRLIRVALTAATNNPKLFDCTPQSLGLALMTASQLGIEPNGRDGHLVPYGKVCQFIPDYKGLIRLAYMNPRVLSFHASAEREADEFDFEYGTASFIKHKPALNNRGELKAAYAVCKLKDADPQFTVMGEDEVLKRKAVAQTNKVWDAWPDEMWAKTAVKSLSKFIPLGGTFQDAVAHDNELDGRVAVEIPFSRLPEPDPQKSGSEALADAMEADALLGTTAPQRTAKAAADAFPPDEKPKTKGK